MSWTNRLLARLSYVPFLAAMILVASVTIFSGGCAKDNLADEVKNALESKPAPAVLPMVPPEYRDCFRTLKISETATAQEMLAILNDEVVKRTACGQSLARWYEGVRAANVAPNPETAAAKARTAGKGA